MKMNGFTSSDQAFIDKLTGIIHANLENENFGVNELASHASMSRTRLHRRLMALMSKPSCQFIREVRLLKARELILEKGITAAEAAYSTGFGSPSYFSTCFHEFFGYPPGKIVRNEVPADSEKKPESNGSVEMEKGLRSRLKFRKAFRIAMLILIPVVILFQSVYLILSSRSSSYNFASITLGSRIREMEKSIAILPFKNLTDNKEVGFFVEGVTDDINNQLLKIRDFRVVSRIDVEQFRGTSLPAEKIADMLKVNFLLSGNIQEAEKQLVIHAELIDARYGQGLWSQKFTFELSDYYKIQDEIATQIAEKLQTQLSEDELRKITKSPSANPEAISNYIKGRYHWSMRTEKELNTSIEYFQSAIKADPNFALAYAGLADCYYYQTIISALPRDVGLERASKMCDKALSLDNNLSEAYATKGMLYRMEWKWKEARSALEHAIRLKPDNAIAHLYYSQFLSSLGEYPEALQQIDLAITLNPAVPSMYYHRASCLSWYGKYKEALETSQKIQTLSPDYYSAYFQQAWLYHVMGEDKKAAESFKKAYIYSDEVKIFADSVVPAYEKGGWKGLVRLRIRIEMAEKSVSNFAISKLYMELEDYERALKYLVLAVENNDRGLPQIISGEIFKPLHGDPRFESIRKKVALDRNMTYR